MTLGALLSLLTGLVRFWPSVVEFIKILQKTPEEKHAEIISRVLDASKLADSTKGDTSGYENLFKGR